MPFFKPPKAKIVEKLFKFSQNRPIIKLSKFFEWTITPLCENFRNLKPTQNCIRSRKIDL